MITLDSGKKKSADLTTGQARELVSKLSIHFNVPKPQLIRSRGLGSFYNSRGQVIRLGVRASEHKMGVTDSVIHEFAHHLNFLTNGGIARVEHLSTRSFNHGVHFQKTLMMVVRAHYSSALQYSWAAEYSKVRNYAIRVLESSRWAALAAKRPKVKRVMSTERLVALLKGGLASPKTPAHLKAGLQRKLDSLTVSTINLYGLEVSNEDVPF